jgi:hypothetical protein
VPHPPNLIREHASPLLELTRAASARRHRPLSRVLSDRIH